ncbi:hypothetical protein BS47DRAFT_1319170 [Hydnum rufescens UP504]|uniref:Major facilitator superfamily (MFS) profile domain-containing protein n=1 Tax=Hydnum rufescens UP504 TaxID=1448309 RepID=A0A9P6DRJ0_9AGAM|nr:hypothetical protein BS47DRAFT_1319170 [Hydnum rufescens UP504]
MPNQGDPVQPDSPAPHPTQGRPWGLEWRSSVWFVTLVVGFGIAVDVWVYNMIVPVIPFRLNTLGYKHVASKTSLLLFTYSLGLVLSIPPIVWLSEHFGGSRKSIILYGQAFLAGSQVLFMFAPNYGVMILSRILQGISGSVIWTLGLALLCDTVPERRIGQQLGMAMAGLSIGFVAYHPSFALGPPLGGILYDNFGFHAPFILGIALAVADFVGRVLIIERKVSVQWGVDPWGPHQPSQSLEEPSHSAFEMSITESVTQSPRIDQHVGDTSSLKPTSVNVGPLETERPRTLSSWGVLWALMRSSRAMVAVVNTLICGTVFTPKNLQLTLRLHHAWGLSPLKVGLVYIAAAIPTMVAGGISGFLTDRFGPKYIATLSLGLSTPWLMLLILRSHLALFIIALALFMFFLSGVIAPMTTELAATSRGLPGVGYGHVFGAWMLAYSLGSTLGPIIGGPIYDHVRHGWLVLCIMQTCLVILALTLSLMFTGDTAMTHKFGPASSSTKTLIR